MIPVSWDQVPHWTPCSAGSLLLPLPATPPACALLHSLWQINKKSLKKQNKTKKPPLVAHNQHRPTGCWWPHASCCLPILFSSRRLLRSRRASSEAGKPPPPRVFCAHFKPSTLPRTSATPPPTQGRAPAACRHKCPRPPSQPCWFCVQIPLKSSHSSGSSSHFSISGLHLPPKLGQKSNGTPWV